MIVPFSPLYGYPRVLSFRTVAAPMKPNNDIIRGGRTPALCALRHRWGSTDTLRENLRQMGWEGRRMGYDNKCSELDLFLHAARGGYQARGYSRVLSV